MDFPVKLKDMIDPEVYRIYDIDSQMTFNRAKEMVKGVITNRVITIASPPSTMTNSCQKLSFMVS